MEWSCEFMPDKSEFKNSEWSDNKVKHFSNYATIGKVGKKTKHWYRRKKISNDGDGVVSKALPLPKI